MSGFVVECGGSWRGLKVHVLLCELADLLRSSCLLDALSWVTTETLLEDSLENFRRARS